MLYRLIKFLQGYLLIEITGNALERFINQIVEEGILLWDLNRINKNKYLAKIDFKEFNNLRPLVKKRMCWVKIVEKKGLPFIIYRMKVRRFLLAAFILFFVIMYLGSSFVWFIKIEGLDRVSSKKIYSILNESGIRPGILKSKIDIEKTEKDILQQEPRISWVNLSWEGTQLKVKIIEKKVINESREGHKIVAAKNGIIKKLIVLQGQQVVEEGDTVVAGQPLILGLKENGGFKEAKGIVEAIVWYEGEGQANIIDKTVKLTGRTTTVWWLKVGKGLIPLFPGKNNYKSYIIEREIKKAVKWRNIALPIELIKETYKEAKYLYEKRSIDTASFLAKERALKNIFTKLPPEAVIQEIITDDIIVYDSSVKVRLIAKVEEDIAKY